MREMRITLQVVELRGGGFILAEEVMEGQTVTWDATQAVSSIDEACGCAQRRLREWHQECRQLKAAELEDSAPTKIIAPRKWWRNAG